MQQMIRQLAAEYTSKKTPTQDPILPNSTRNQSLSKASPVQSSPTAATTRNPVLSKLLMADQESPLDLTVKKSQLESKEQDGVLDLSTKKSPSVRCSSLSPSPSGSSTLGNGDKTTTPEVIHQKTQKTPTLEKLMVALFPHHQKQNVHMLSDLDIEGQLSPENINTSASSMCDTHYSKMHDEVAVFSEEMVNVASELHVNHSDSRNSICVCCEHLKENNTKSSKKVRCSDGEKCISSIKEESSDLLASSFGTPTAVFTPECFAASNKILNVNPISESVAEGAAAATSEPTSDVKKEECSPEKMPVNCYIEVKIPSLNVDHGSNSNASQNTLLKTLSEETFDSDVIMCSAKKVDNGNSLQSKIKASLKEDLEINEHPVSPNQESLTAQGRNKVGNNLPQGAKCKIDNSKDNCPTVRKTSNRQVRMKPAPDTKTVRNCQRASGVCINDYDNQCDVVYISQPITECQFEKQGSILTSRKTARKSTRGYLFNGEYCAISTVRTLFRSSKAVEILNCSKFIKERLVFPSQSLSTTLPLMQMAVVANPEKADISVTSVDVSLPGSPCHKDKFDISSIAVEQKLQLEPGDSAVIVARKAATSPLMAILSHEEKTHEDISFGFQSKAVRLPSSVKYEEDTKPVTSFTSTTEEIEVCAEPLNKSIPEVNSTEAPVSFPMEKGFVDSNTAGSKEVLNCNLNSDAECISQIFVDNTAYPEISTPVFSTVAPFEKESVGPGSEYASVESLEELHRNSSNDPTFENKNCARSRSTESLGAEEVANVEGALDITAAFSSKSSLEECHIDSRLTLSFEDSQEDLVECRSPYSPEGSFGEDSVDFTLALSLEDTPRKDAVGSRDDFSTEDGHIEAVVGTTYEHSSDDVCGDISENHIICPIEKSSDSNGASFTEESKEVSDSISFFHVSNEKVVMGSVATTLDLHSDDNVANGDISSSTLSVKEDLDSRYTSSFPISDSNLVECFGVAPLSEDDLGTKLIPASPSELSVREKDICIKPASPSEVITGEGAIHVALVSPSPIVKTDECGGNVSASLPAASIRKSKKPSKPHNTSKRSAVNACSNNKAKKQQGAHQEKACEELIGNPNLKKVKTVGPGKSETVQDNHKKSDPQKKQNVDKNVLKKKSKKKKKSKFIKSDRRLRSQFLRSAALSTNECSASSQLNVPCLKIKLVKSSGAKSFQRTVHLHKGLSVIFPVGSLNKTLLEKMSDSNLDDSENSVNEYPVTTRQLSKNMQAKSISERFATLSKPESNLTIIRNSPAEGLQILVDMNTNERKVQLSINCPVNQTQNTERTPPHISTLDLDNIKNKTVIVGSKSHDSLASSQRFHNSASENTPKLSQTFMKQKNLILRNHNLRLASKRETFVKKDLTAENSKVVNAKVENSSSSGKEENICSKTSVALNEEPQENNRVKFTNCLAEEENQELIADFNAKYMKVQKGWILLEKEAMPMHRAKNKSDKLKEIWKTKKRVRKIRNSSEPQKLSPIQILFMKAFKLSDICKWFLETTETKSLVIVKKVSTRLPGDFPMAMIPVQRCASSVTYPPSAQAERLKKHLKKFAAASPLKNNSKTQKMWAKFRDPIEDSESSASTSSSPTSLDVVNDHRNSKSTQNVKTPASARILRKYSNMRGKLRSHNCMLNSEKSSGKKASNEDEKIPSQTDVCLTPLMSPKCALQGNNDAYCDGSERDLKSNKKKKQSLDLIKSDTEPEKKKRKLDSSNAKDSPISSVKVRPTVKKVSSKVEQKDSQTHGPSARKQNTLDCIGKGSSTASLKGKKAKVESKNIVQTENPSLLKGNKSKDKTKTVSNALLATSPKAKGAKVSSCKANAMRKNEPHVGKAHTRSMKNVLINDVLEDKIKLKSKLRPRPVTK